MSHRLSAALRALVVLIGLAALAFLLGEPHLEGRNAHATLFEVYFKDPFLAYVYVGSIPFFVGLYQAFVTLGAFGQAPLKALRTIRNCALTVIAFTAGGELFIMLSPSDDRAGGVFMGLLVASAAALTAAAAAKFERSQK